MEQDRVIAVVSGGIDSVTMLYWLIDRGFQPHVITFDYGQRHVKEIECVKKIMMNLYRDESVIGWEIIQLPFFNRIGAYMNMKKASALLKHDVNLPHEHYTHENQKLTVVPNRNMVMLSIATAFAEAGDMHEVFYAAHHNDYTIYPDCHPEFVDALSNTTQLATYNKVQVIAPFVKWTKSDIVAEGKRLKVPFEDTWSCYEGEEKACGKCGTCQERIEAFKANGMIDPIPYAISIDWEARDGQKAD